MEAEYPHLLSQLTQLIDSCSNGEGESAEANLTVIREVLDLVHQQYLPGIEFYKVWLKYQTQLQREHKAGFLRLFDVITKEFAHFQLITACVDHILELHEEEVMTADEVRDLLEASVRVCGTDLFTGGAVWEKYLSWEVEEYEYLLEGAADPSALAQAKERFIKLFHRALSLPLVDGEKILQHCQQVLEEHCLESDQVLIRPEALAQKVSAAMASRALRLPYEMNLQKTLLEANPDSRQVCEQFSKCIAFELQSKDLPRAQRLYERLLLISPLPVDVYLEYAFFLAFTLKAYSTCSVLLQRVCKVHSHLLLHQMTVWCWEATHADPSQITLYYASTIAKGLASADDYLDFYMTVGNYHRRGILAHPADCSVHLQALQGILSDMETFLTAYYPDWTVGWYAYTKYRTEVEYVYVIPSTQGVAPKITQGKPSQRSPLWEQLASMCPGQLWVWQEAMHHYASHGEWEIIRGLYRKILHLPLDVDNAQVCRMFGAFEDLHGDLDSLLAAYGKMSSVLLQQTRLALLAASGIEEVPAAPVQPHVKANKPVKITKPTVVQAKKRPASSMQDDAQMTAKASSVAPKPIINAGSKDSGEKAHKKARFEEPPQAPDQPMDMDLPAPQPSAPVLPGPAVHHHALLVKNFPFTAALPDLTVFLHSVLPITADRLQMDMLTSKAGHSRGIVRVVCESAEDLEVALKALQGVQYNNRALQVEEDTAYHPLQPIPAVTTASGVSEAPPANVAQDGAVKSAVTTVFLNNLHADAKNDDLKAFFADCGEITAVKVNRDRKTGESKGTGLVQFNTSKARDRALLLSKKSLRGQEVIVQKSRFAITSMTAEQLAEEAKHSAELAQEAAELAQSQKPAAEAQQKAEESKKKFVVEKTTMFKPRVMKARIQL